MQFHREQEFWVANGAMRYGMCGPNAAASAEAWASQAYVGTVTLYQRMAASDRLTDVSGAANIWQIQAQIAADGFKTALLPFAQNGIADWLVHFQNFLATGAVVVMETANGQALVDRISGKGENAQNLQYHFILLCEWHPGGYNARAGQVLDPGFFAADGDNYAVGNVLQFYDVNTLAAAVPCAACAVYARVAITAPGGAAMSVPDGYTDANNIVTCTANGHTIARGIRDNWLQNPGVFGKPLDEEHAISATNTEQTFELRIAGMQHQPDGSWAFLNDFAGHRVIQLVGQLAAANTALQQAQAAIAQKDATIATLNSQLASIPTTGPTTGPVAISAADQAKIQLMNQFIAMVKGAA